MGKITKCMQCGCDDQKLFEFGNAYFYCSDCQIEAQEAEQEYDDFMSNQDY